MAELKQRVLLVEDEALTGRMMRLNLEHEGYEVVLVTTGDGALRTMWAERFDLIVLDYMLPGMDGQSIIQRARRENISTPILMVTARGEIENKIRALDLGADDYLTKPFDMPELLARAKALIRRSQSAMELPALRRIRVGAAWIDLDERVATVGEVRHELKEKEARLLELFAQEPGRIFSRADIIDEVWGMNAVPTPRTVDNFIVRLRRIVEPEPAKPQFILSVRGEGYRLAP